jgi:hypothetical protein
MSLLNKMLGGYITAVKIAACNAVAVKRIWHDINKNNIATALLK